MHFITNLFELYHTRPIKNAWWIYPLKCSPGPLSACLLSFCRALFNCKKRVRIEIERRNKSFAVDDREELWHEEIALVEGKNCAAFAEIWLIIVVHSCSCWFAKKFSRDCILFIVERASQLQFLHGSLTNLLVISRAFCSNCSTGG